MSQVNELLNTMAEDEIAAYTADSENEPHIVIDKDRFAKVPEELRRIAIEGEHNVETVTFDCPRYWDKHDLTKMILYIRYECPDGKTGGYQAQNVRVDDTATDIIHFEWTITENVTGKAGTLAFMVVAKKSDEESGESLNRWHSELNTEMYISKGIPGETVDYTTGNPDLLTQALLLAERCTGGSGGNANIDVTAEVGQTIVVKAVDENGKPTAWESADYQERTHWTFPGGGLVLDGQTVTFGSDGMGAISGTLDIEAGKTYVVIWDGEEYICDCKTGYYSGVAVVYLGNPVFLGLDNNGLPFVIGKVLANGYTMAACLQPNTTHSVGILSATVNKIPERYMGDNEFVLHFEGDASTKGNLTVKETAQEIFTAIASGKKFICEHYGIFMGIESKSTIYDYTVASFASASEGAQFVVVFGPSRLGPSYGHCYEVAVSIDLDTQGVITGPWVRVSEYTATTEIDHMNPTT